MIIFVEGPHREIMKYEEQQAVLEMMTRCTDDNEFVNQVNTKYNNKYHFCNPRFDYNIEVFLEELKMFSDSIYHQVQVMGTIHTDAYGHTSMLHREGKIVKDTYLRFKIVMDQQHMKITRVLKPGPVYHFLVGMPVEV